MRSCGWIAYPHDKPIPALEMLFKVWARYFLTCVCWPYLYGAAPKSEPSLQRQDLELTRNELEGQKLALTAQSETLKKQNFEDTFFRMLVSKTISYSL